MKTNFSGRVHWFRLLLSEVNVDGLDAEERTRLQHYSVFLLSGIPTMAVFGLYSLLIGRYLLCLFIFASAIGMSVGSYRLRKSRNQLLIYRVNAALFGGLLIYLVVLGGPDGSKSLWSYTYPLICYFLLGRYEGLVWTTGLLGLAVLVFFLPPGLLDRYSYSLDFKIRFVFSYLIVSAVTYWFEYFRNRYRQEMEDRQRLLEHEKSLLNEQIKERQRAEQEKEAIIAQLQTTLAEVQTLEGLVPICMQCKKIRNDVGFWQRIEQYIEARTDARFSHGLCPDCADMLYPELNLGQSGSQNDDG